MTAKGASFTARVQDAANTAVLVADEVQQGRAVVYVGRDRQHCASTCAMVRALLPDAKVHRSTPASLSLNTGRVLFVSKAMRGLCADTVVVDADLPEISDYAGLVVAGSPTPRVHDRR